VAATLAYYYTGHSLGLPATIAFVATLVVWIVWKLVRRRKRR
jgi:hypothetical protein